MPAALRLASAPRTPTSNRAATSPPGVGASTTRTCGAGAVAGPSDVEILARSPVTPWYDRPTTITLSPPVTDWQMRSARSFASLPVQVNITCDSGSGKVSSRRSA